MGHDVDSVAANAEFTINAMYTISIFFIFIHLVYSERLENKLFFIELVARSKYKLVFLAQLYKQPSVVPKSI